MDAAVEIALGDQMGAWFVCEPFLRYIAFSEILLICVLTVLLAEERTNAGEGEASTPLPRRKGEEA